MLFISPLAIRREKNKSIVDKLAEHDRLQRDDSVFAYYLRQGIGNILIIGIWISIAAQAAYSLGELEAKKKTEFLVRSSVPETVVLTIDGDYFVTAQFDRAKKTVEKNIVVIKAAEAPNVAMHFETVGPLRPKG